MSAVLETLLRAAAGEQAVQLRPELARKLLSCANDGEIAACLGLSLRQRVRVRNDALAQAAQELGADGCTTWQAAQRLAQAVRRFEQMHPAGAKPGASRSRRLAARVAGRARPTP